jgi:hypothetical protein
MTVLINLKLSRLSVGYTGTYWTLQYIHKLVLILTEGAMFELRSHSHGMSNYADSYQ